MKARCIDVLIQEHKIILRALDVLSAMGNDAAATQRLNKEDVEGILEIFRVFADEFHQGKEEGALFPVFTAGCNASEINAVRHMLFEHDQDRSLIEGMDDALWRSDASDFCKHAERLASILRTHIYKEENILFEIIDKGLSADDDQKVIKEYEGFDHDFTNRGHDRLMHRLRTLEQKYLRNVA